VKGVRGTGDAAAAGVAEDVGVDHGRLDVFMPEELLDGADIVAGDQQMGGEAVPEGMAADLFADTGGARGSVDGLADGVVTNSKLGAHPVEEAPGTPGRGPRKGLRGIHGSK
jgi:hypothetical protein